MSRPAHAGPRKLKFRVSKDEASPFEKVVRKRKKRGSELLNVTLRFLFSNVGLTLIVITVAYLGKPCHMSLSSFP